LRVPVADRDPESVFGRPMRVMMLGGSVPMTLVRHWDSTGSGIEAQTRAIMRCSLVPQDWHFEMPGQPVREYPDFCAKQDEAQQLGLDMAPDVVLFWSGAWDIFDHVSPDGE